MEGKKLKRNQKLAIRVMELRKRFFRKDDGDGQWITTENGHHVHINGEGVPDIGNSHVIAAMTGKTSGKSSFNNWRSGSSDGRGARNPNKLKSSDFESYDKFLDAAGIPKLTQNDVDNINDSLEKALGRPYYKREEELSMFDDALYACRDGSTVKVAFDTTPDDEKMGFFTGHNKGEYEYVKDNGKWYDKKKFEDTKRTGIDHGGLTQQYQISTQIRHGATQKVKLSIK